MKKKVKLPDIPDERPEPVARIMVEKRIVLSEDKSKPVNYQLQVAGVKKEDPLEAVAVMLEAALMIVKKCMEIEQTAIAELRNPSKIINPNDTIHLGGLGNIGHG